MHWEVRSSSGLQQAAGQLLWKPFGPCCAVGHNVADPCKWCVLSCGNGIPSQCDRGGGVCPSQGNLLPLAGAGHKWLTLPPRMRLNTNSLYPVLAVSYSRRALRHRKRASSVGRPWFWCCCLAWLDLPYSLSFQSIQESSL